MPSRLRFKRQFSSGGIIFRKSHRGILVALISREGGRVWCLPKGLVEPGESVEQTALREVREETGLTGTLVEKLGDIRYWYVSKEEKTRYFKRVCFFLFRYKNGSIRDHDFEVDEVAWVPISGAIKKLTYPTERKLLKKAGQMLKPKVQ